MVFSEKKNRKSEDEIIICRCEDITLSEVHEAISNGATTLDEIKRLLRCGMGHCQGSTCRKLIQWEICKLTGKPLDQISPATFRPPLKPIPLEQLKDLHQVQED